MLQLLNNIQHKDLRVVTQRGAQWGDDFMSAPATVDEFRRLQAHYPIVFQPDGKGGHVPVVLFGLKEGQNLFLTPDGWDADYLPLSVQRLPFSIGVADDELRMMVDMSSRRIGSGAEGEAVFMPQGGTTDFTENANAVLHTLHEGLQSTTEFIRALMDNELLEPFTLDVERPDGTRGELVGYAIINEERLAALDAGTVALLHQADYLMPIYMAIASLSNFTPLIKRHLAREADWSSMLERSDVRAEALPAEVLQSTQPVLLRGLVRHWPLVQAAGRSDADFCGYLRRFGEQTRLAVWRGAPEIAGRFFYNEDFSGFNFQRETHGFGELLDELLASTPDALYLGSTEIDSAFPGLGRDNPLHALAGVHPHVSLWLGNRMQVATHFDLPDNIACVVAGRRRFTLFPPEQVANLYIGPLDLTPAGQPVSLVDTTQPDFERFPRYAQALKHAQTFELLPGDALFIPSQWWHGVESLEPVSALVNFWWRQSPAFMDTPLNTLMMALLSLRDLPPAQRDAWRALFDHYVFEADEQTAAHIPPAARGILAPMDEDGARQLRAALRNRLNR